MCVRERGRECVYDREGVFVHAYAYVCVCMFACVCVYLFEYLYVFGCTQIYVNARPRSLRVRVVMEKIVKLNPEFTELISVMRTRGNQCDIFSNDIHMVHMYIYTGLCICMYIDIYTHRCTCKYLFSVIYIYIHVYIHVYVYIYTYIHIYMKVYTYIHIYIYTYTYIYTHVYFET